MAHYHRQKPNRKTLGFLFHLRVHNAYRNSSGKAGSWIRETIGEQPAIYDSIAQNRTIRQFEIYLKEQGYYSPIISTQVKTSFINSQKARVIYSIETGKPYIISSIQYDIPDTNIARIVARNINRSAISEQAVFNVHSLLEERNRLASIINNHGYYSFSAQDIFFSADTSRGNLQVDVTLGILPNLHSDNQMHQQYKIRNTIIYADFDTHTEQKELKSFQYDSTTTFRYYDSLYVKPEVIMRALYISSGSIYNASRVRRTQRQLSQNNLFRIVQISFEEVSESDSSYTYIDCIIRITRTTQQSFSIELEGQNTAGDWGAKANFSYSHKNVFKGAENLQIRLTAMAEHNQSIVSETTTRFFNTHELGAEARLDIPKFLSPITPDRFDVKYRPTTTFRIAYNHMQNILFTRPTSNFSYGYRWFGNNHLTHYLTPIDISYIRYYNKTDEFNEFLAQREYYRFSYEDYLIYSTQYSLVFYNKRQNIERNYQYFRLHFESAGNSMYLLFNTILDSDNDTEKKPHETFNVVFAQYIKTELDYRFYNVLTRKTLFVSRFFGGVAIPYLNSEWTPSVKQFYMGGANSLRGWSARSVGPGSYQDTMSSFQYNMGDIKLEVNFELRFPMFWVVEGAIFTDIGNIWSFRNKNLEGAAFSPTRFISESAIALGYGFRFDFSFLLFRFDIGAKLREPFPIEKSNSQIIWGNRKMSRDDFNLSIGIGYPF